MNEIKNLLHLIGSASSDAAILAISSPFAGRNETITNKLRQRMFRSAANYDKLAKRSGDNETVDSCILMRNYALSIISMLS